MSKSTTTIPEEHPQLESSWGEDVPLLALVVVYAAGEPWRIGSLAVLSSSGSTVPHILGRGDDATDARASVRLQFGFQRPSGFLRAPPLTCPQISREQLRLHFDAASSIEVENVGRCSLWYRGARVEHVRLKPGDLLQLGRHLVLLCVLRPRRLRGPSPTEYPTPDFGLCDKFGILGESQAAWAIRAQLLFVAQRRGHVLIQGPSGSGKELAARAVHALSERATRALVARSAATIPDGIADAELFGNLRNYPNAGMPERPGLVGSADGSTLFLDEFAELSQTGQAHLLRVLDAGEYQRLGETRMRHSDFRLIAATNRPDSAIKQDILARFPFRIVLPGLNERAEDVPLVARHLLGRLEKQGAPRSMATSGVPPELSPELTCFLVQRTYTTHVRELETLLWEAIAQHRGGELALSPRFLDGDVLPEESAGRASPQSVPRASGLSAEHIQAALDRNNGSLEETYRALGLKNRFVLRRLIKKHGLLIRRQFS